MEQIINAIRDILRREGITSKDSINHCVVFFISRILTEKKCKKLNICKIFAFKNIMKNKKGEELGDQEFYDRIYNLKGNCLILEIRNKLGFKNIKFRLEGIHNLKLIYKKLKKIDVKNLQIKYDIIGTIYEWHLKTGTNNARDLGQYYTNRQVIDYMINLCNPKMKNGIIEKIVDPTMGTGGFLTMCIKYLNKKYNNKIDWEKNKNNIIGFDIDNDVKNMALINIFLEINEICEKTIMKQDTLHHDMKFDDGTFLEKADVILANEPMGIKGITHAECCDRIKDMKMRGTKAEPLFLQLFMSALDDNGRCAVIVSDGVLFSESNLHRETRKYLIENFNLKKIVLLNGDYFINTKIKTAILFFVKDGNKTKGVEFSELYLKDNKIEEKNIINVKYNKLVKNNYSLFVNKYNIVEQEKIEGMKYEKIGNICNFLKKSKRPASYGKLEGKYNFYTSSEKIKKCDKADYDEECIIIGTGGNANIKFDNKFSCSVDNIILKSNNKNIKLEYIFMYLSNDKKLLENGFRGATIKHISKSYIENIEIPIPQTNVQKKIVEEIRVLNNNNNKLKKKIDDNKKKIESVIPELLCLKK